VRSASSTSTGVYVQERADATIQLEGTSPTGYRIQPGFSGAPVWDLSLGRVTGMVVLSERVAETKVAFMIPIRLLETVAHRSLNIVAPERFEEVSLDKLNMPPERSRWRRYISSLFEDR
jgi:hypothetical protein